MSTVPPRAFSNPVRAAARLALIVVVTLCYLVGWLVVASLQRSTLAVYRKCTLWTQSWLRTLARCAGFHLNVSGTLPAPGSFIAPNHQTYADIVVVGGQAPCFFVAKSEVGQWPAIGYLFRKSYQIAVRRDTTQNISSTSDEIAKRLSQGLSITVFLEGTSTGGDGPLREFRPALLQGAIDAGARVVPCGVRWRVRDPKVVIAEDVAYWKDHVLVPHLFRFLGFGGIACDVVFGTPIDATGRERRELAQAVQRAVEDLLAAMPASTA